TSPVKYDRAGRTPALAPGVTLVDGRALVRNVDPAESEIARTTVAQFRENYRLPEIAKMKSSDDEGLKSLATAGERPDELWRAVAWALLIVFVLETFVANRTYA